MLIYRNVYSIDSVLHSISQRLFISLLYCSWMMHKVAFISFFFVLSSYFLLSVFIDCPIKFIDESDLISGFRFCFLLFGQTYLLTVFVFFIFFHRKLLSVWIQTFSIFSLGVTLTAPLLCIISVVEDKSSVQLALDAISIS